MKFSSTKDLETGAIWLSETHFLIAEVNDLIASAKARIERQRKYIGAASDEESSKRMLADLATMVSALNRLKAYRARTTSDDKKPRSA